MKSFVLLTIASLVIPPPAECAVLLASDAGSSHITTIPECFLTEALSASLFTPIDPLEPGGGKKLKIRLPQWLRRISRLTIHRKPPMKESAMPRFLEMKLIVAKGSDPDIPRSAMDTAQMLLEQFLAPFGGKVPKEIRRGPFTDEARKNIYAQHENAGLREWMQNQESSRIRRIAAILDILLIELAYPLEIQRATAPLENLLSLRAHEELLAVALHSQDLITVAGALDALTQLDDENALRAFRERRFYQMLIDYAPRSGERRDVWNILPFFARLQGFPNRIVLDNPAAEEILKAHFRLDDLDTAHVALNLLAFQPVSLTQAQNLLDQLLRTPPPPDDFDHTVMLTMLAMLECMKDRLPYEQAIDSVRREITRTHWRDPQFGLQTSWKAGLIARQLGEIIHRDNAYPAMTTFMGYLFQMGFLESTGRLPKGTLLPLEMGLSEEDFKAAQRQGAAFIDSATAGRFQFVALNLFAADEGRAVLPWNQIYHNAAILTQVAPSISLSEISERLVRDYIGTTRIKHAVLELGPRDRRADRQAGRVKVLLPDMVPADDMPFSYRHVDKPEKRNWDWYVQHMRSIINSIYNTGHFDPSKYRELFLDFKDAITAYILHDTIPSNLISKHIEIHITDKCQNRCIFCRGAAPGEGLRDVPEVEAELTAEQTIAFIDSILNRNPRAFFRFSGTIGDPSHNNELLKVLKHLNLRKARWGITTNGLSMPRKLRVEMMYAQWVQVSVDAGSDATYLKLKKPNTAENLSNKPFTAVMSNMKELIQMRGMVRSPKTIIRQMLYGSLWGWWRARRLHGPKIIGSLLVQEENFRDIPQLSSLLKKMGADEFQIKIQHYDIRRTMTQESIDKLYDDIIPTVQLDRSNHYKIQVLQDKRTAEQKNGLVQIGESAIQKVFVPFQKCFVGLVNPVLRTSGRITACCQPEEDILPAFGNILENSFDAISNSARRLEVMAMNPSTICASCSPSDEFINGVMEFFRQGRFDFPDDPAKVINEFWRLMELREVIEKTNGKPDGGHPLQILHIGLSPLSRALAKGRELFGRRRPSRFDRADHRYSAASA